MNPTVTPSTSLPPVSQLFTDSWQSLKQSFGKLLLLHLIGFGIAIAVAIFLVLLAVLFGAGSIFSNLSHLNSPAILGPLILTAGILFIIALIIFIFIGLALQIST